MRKYIFIVIALILVIQANAEVITLRSGQQINGTIVLQNSDVLIIQSDKGGRFQYPMSEVVKIEKDAVIVPQKEEDTPRTKRPIAARVTLGGGVACVPNHTVGGSILAEVAIGTRNLAKKRIFLGGSVGYNGMLSPEKHHFIPLQAVVSVPLMNGKHAPELGAGLGYVFSTKGHKGGIAASMQLLWRYEWNDGRALLMGGFAKFQHGDKTVLETFEDRDYNRTMGAVYILSGVNMSIQF